MVVCCHSLAWSLWSQDFTPDLAWLSGTSQMEYKRQENRALFIALFRGMVTFAKCVTFVFPVFRYLLASGQL